MKNIYGIATALVTVLALAGIPSTAHAQHGSGGFGSVKTALPDNYPKTRAPIASVTVDRSASSQTLSSSVSNSSTRSLETKENDFPKTRVIEVKRRRMMVTVHVGQELEVELARPERGYKWQMEISGDSLKSGRTRKQSEVEVYSFDVEEAGTAKVYFDLVDSYAKDPDNAIVETRELRVRAR